MTSRSALLPLALGIAIAGAASAGEGPGAQAPLVKAVAQTEPTRGGGPDSAVLLPGAGKQASRIVGTAALGGLETYDAQGKRLSATAAGEAVSVDIVHDVALGGSRASVVAAIDGSRNGLRLFRADDAGLLDIGARPLQVDFAAEGVCLGRNPIDGALYAYVVGDGGEIEHLVLFADASGRLDARRVRRLHVPSTVKECSVGADGALYAIQETTGIWRFNGNPEADVEARIVDAPRIGRLDEEGKGVAVFEGGGGRHWLFASDTSGGAINLYDRDDDDRFLGRFRVGDAVSGEAVAEPSTLSVATAAQFAAGGALLVTDEDAANYKIVAVDDIASALRLPAASPSRAATAAKPVVALHARVESVPARSYGDAADDPAIWANPADPARSLVVATDKKAGLYVYDMQGRVVQFRPDGKMNNVDLREGFELAGQRVVLVTASNRTDQTIAIYRLDTASGELVDVADGPQPTGLGDPYGLCMYRSPRDGATYVFVNGDDTRQRQWRLVDAGNGKVRAEHVRDMAFDSQTEGCVADDANANLFVNEEDIALWRLSAEPDGGDAKTAVARVADNSALEDDLEGMSLYDLGDGRGYIVLSSQGNDSYAVFDRRGEHRYLGSFSVAADAASGIDGISETDGLDVSSGNLGPGFEHGAMVAQDGRNVMPVENQNYKYVSWDDIARALGLEVRMRDGE